MFVSADMATGRGGVIALPLPAVLPVLALLVFEVARRLPGDGPDRIPLIRWALFPVRSARVWRQMVLWDIPYAQARAHETTTIYARCVVAAHYGTRSWRKARRLVDPTVRHQLTDGRLPDAVLRSLDPRSAARTWIHQELREPAAHRHVICSGPNGTVFLRRPTPTRKIELAGPVGAHVPDLGILLHGPHASVVYFARNGNRVKIGTTQNLRSRMSALCLRIDDITLVLHGGQAFERLLHARFAELRVRNTEWFKLSGPLAAFIRAGGQQADERADPEHHLKDLTR